MKGGQERSSEVWEPELIVKTGRCLDSEYLQLLEILKKYRVFFHSGAATKAAAISAANYSNAKYVVQINLRISLRPIKVSRGQKVKEKLVRERTAGWQVNRDELKPFYLTPFLSFLMWVLPAMPWRQKSHWCAPNLIHKSRDSEWVRQSVGKTVSDRRWGMSEPSLKAIKTKEQQPLCSLLHSTLTITVYLPNQAILEGRRTSPIPFEICDPFVHSVLTSFSSQMHQTI